MKIRIKHSTMSDIPKQAPDPIIGSVQIEDLRGYRHLVVRAAENIPERAEVTLQIDSEWQYLAFVVGEETRRSWGFSVAGREVRKGEFFWIQLHPNVSTPEEITNLSRDRLRIDPDV